MGITFDELKKVTSEALMISMIKMLVFQELRNKLEIDEDILKEEINKKPNEFFKPTKLCLKTQSDFTGFIKNLSNKLFEEIKENDGNVS